MMGTRQMLWGLIWGHLGTRGMIKFFALSGVLIAGGWLVAVWGLSEVVEAFPETEGARVERVIDGDTIAVRRGNRILTVRLIGIDTPETKRPGVAVECGGAEAAAALERLLEPGKRVSLVIDRSQDRVDRYGRLLRYVEVGNRERDVGVAQVRGGHAEPYVVDDDFKRLDIYRANAQIASSKGAGVHSACCGVFHSES